MLLDQLYLPTPYDYATGIAPRRYVETFQGTFTGLTNDINFTPVPANRILWVQRVAVALGSTVITAEVITVANIVVQEDVSGATSTRGFLFLIDDLQGNIGARVSHTSEPNVILMPGEYLSSAVSKNAAVAVFRHTFTVWGLLLPRANIQSG